MGRPDKYITLMASMPALQTPLQRPRAAALAAAPGQPAQVAGRATMRTAAADRARHGMGADRMADSDADVIAELDALMAALTARRLRTVVRDRFELRTVLAAMRRRRRGEAAPPAAALGIRALRRSDPPQLDPPAFRPAPHDALARRVARDARCRRHARTRSLMLRLDWSKLVDARGLDTNSISTRWCSTCCGIT